MGPIVAIPEDAIAELAEAASWRNVASMFPAIRFTRWRAEDLAHEHMLKALVSLQANLVVV